MSLLAQQNTENPKVSNMVQLLQALVASNGCSGSRRNGNGRRKWQPPPELANLPAPKAGEQDSRKVGDRMAYYCDWHKRWSYVSQHTSDACRQKARAATEQKDKQATLTAHLAALLASNNEDDLFSHVHLGMAVHDDFDVLFKSADGQSVDTSSSGTPAMPNLLTRDESSIDASSIDTSQTRSAENSMPSTPPHVQEIFIHDPILVFDQEDDLSLDYYSSSDDESMPSIAHYDNHDEDLDDEFSEGTHIQDSYDDPTNIFQA